MQQEKVRVIWALTSDPEFAWRQRDVADLVGETPSRVRAAIFKTHEFFQSRLDDAESSVERDEKARIRRDATLVLVDKSRDAEWFRSRWGLRCAQPSPRGGIVTHRTPFVETRSPVLAPVAAPAPPPPLELEPEWAPLQKEVRVVEDDARTLSDDDDDDDYLPDERWYGREMTEHGRRATYRAANGIPPFAAENPFSYFPSSDDTTKGLLRHWRRNSDDATATLVDWIRTTQKRGDYPLLFSIQSLVAELVWSISDGADLPWGRIPAGRAPWTLEEQAILPWSRETLDICDAVWTALRKRNGRR